MYSLLPFFGISDWLMSWQFCELVRDHGARTKVNGDGKGASREAQCWGDARSPGKGSISPSLRSSHRKGASVIVTVAFPRPQHTDLGPCAGTAPPDSNLHGISKTSNADLPRWIFGTSARDSGSRSRVTTPPHRCTMHHFPWATEFTLCLIRKGSFMTRKQTPFRLKLALAHE